MIATLKTNKNRAEKGIHSGTIHFTAVRRGGAWLLLFVTWGKVIIGVSLAFGGAIGIIAGDEDMGMVGQPIEQDSSEFFVGKDLYPRRS